MADDHLALLLLLKKKQKTVEWRIMKNDGFTLIELLITMVVLTILTLITIPVFSGWLPDYRLRRAARDVYSNMQLAKMSAVRNSTNWAIVFDTGANRYFLCSDDGADSDWTTTGDNAIEKTIDLSNDYGNSIQYGHGSATTDATSGGGAFPADEVSFGAGGNNVAVFNSRGFLDPPSGYVYLSNSKNNSYAIGSLTSGVSILRRWNGAAWE
jgi:prepilin-type N-terminal cleavage/methylation domain-containing protein